MTEKETEKEMEEEMSFAELFKTHPDIPSNKFSPGDSASGRVLRITKDTIFVDLGGKSEGIVDAEEFLDQEGNLTVKEGDRIELKVASIKDGIYLSKGMKVQGAEAMEMLREAHQHQVPVEGRVSGTTKGGFEITLSGIRAFCPASQIDIGFSEKPEEYIGQRHLFRIMEFKEKGRNLVVSRRVLLQEEQEKRSKETLALLQPGLDLEGKVTKLTDFGVFVDIGGIEGMVHVSEISHARIKHPSEVLKINQWIKVKVMKIEEDKGGRQRISLSIKALEPDGWERGFGFKEGEIISGKVSRLTDFGAFIEVAPGVDGLVHISEISYERFSHPKSLLHEGDIVDVLVREIDQDKHRISLSIKEAKIKKQMEAYEEDRDEVGLKVGQILRGIVENIKPYGLFVRLPQIGMGVRGLLPLEELMDPGKADLKRKFPKGKEIQVEILSIDEGGRIRLSQKTIIEREDREDYKNFLEKEDQAGKLGTLGDLLKNIKL